MKNKLDIKGLSWFLAITFSATIAVAYVVFLFMKKADIALGLMAVQVSVLSVMFIPAISSVIVRKFIVKESWEGSGLKIGSYKDYLKVWALLAAAFLFIYAITWPLGAAPDFSLSSFLSANKLTLPMAAWQMIALIYVMTLFITPFINGAVAFGEELGWRGYLLPKLMPLGTNKALIIHGVIWGLWHVPLIFFLGFAGYPDKLLGALLFTAMVTCIGIYFGYLRLKTGSTILASFAHGVFNAQAYGVFQLLFVGYDPFIVGIRGVFALAVFLIIAVWSIRKIKKLKINI